MKSTLLMAASIVALAGTPALAAELVTNGGFETGFDYNTAPAGWTLDAAGGHFHEGDAHTGNIGAAFGSTTGQFDTLSQTIATVAGQSYNFNFWLKNSSTGGDAFRVNFGGTNVLNLTDPTTEFDYTNFSYTVVASSAATTISFAGLDGPDHFYLDDVSVSALGTPEPTTWALMIAGFGMVGASMRRRKVAVTYA